MQCHDSNPLCCVVLWKWVCGLQWEGENNAFKQEKRDANAHDFLLVIDANRRWVAFLAKGIDGRKQEDRNKTPVSGEEAH